MRILTFIFVLLFFFSCEEKNQPPYISIISPLTDTVVQKGEDLTLLVEASDDEGFITEVGFLINEDIIHVSYESPYTFLWETENFDEGDYKLSAYAVDNEGGSSNVSIQVKVEIFNAKVVTDSVNNITSNSAEIHGAVLDNGGSNVTERGVCWSNTPLPVITDNKIENGNDLGNYSVIISDLNSNKTYYVRTYATNEKGTAYGNEIVFKSMYKLDSFTDSRDGKRYSIVEIEDQWWFAENLAYLPNVTVPETGSTSLPYNYVYNQTACGCLSKAKANENFKKYGTLYNWVAAQNVCPEGWHLPNNSEWEQLADYISNDNGGFPNSDGNWEQIGYILKSIESWGNEGNGNNNYGFSVLPAGTRDAESGEFIGITFEGYFWTASETDSEQAICRNLNAQESTFFKSIKNKSSGYSIRCVKD